MKRGKRICNTLKEVRMQVAKANDINYAPTACHHEGDCVGTCPKCEAEVRWLEHQLQLRRQLGKAVAVVGVSVGLAALTACESQLAEMNTDSNISSTMTQSVGNRISEFMGVIAERQPHFPGGQQALLEFLRQNVNYPEQAKKDSIKGVHTVRKFSLNLKKDSGPLPCGLKPGGACRKQRYSRRGVHKYQGPL